MLNADVRVSLQKRLSKKAALHLEALGAKLESLQVGADPWLSSVTSYGGAHRIPLQVELNPYERASIEDFVQTENDVFGKVIVAASVLASELKFLTHEAKHRFLDPLLYYSEDYLDNPSYLSLGRFLPFLQELASYKARCKEVTSLFLQQINALTDRDFAPASVVYLFECLSNLLVCLISADCIIKANNTLREHWGTFKASLNACSHSATTATKVGLEISDAKDIEGFLDGIERELLGGRIFTDCIQVAGKLALSKRFLDALAAAVQGIAADVDNPVVQSQYPAKIGTRIIGVGALLVLNCYVSRTVDKRLLKLFLDACRSGPIVALWRNTSAVPSDVVLQLIPDISKHLDKKLLQVLQLAKDGILQARIQNLARDVFGSRMEAMEWIAKIQLVSKDSQPVIDDDSPRLLRTGLLLARKVQNSIIQLFHFHAVLLKPLTRPVLLLIGNMLEILMVLDGCQETYNTTLSQLVDRVTEVTAHRMTKTLHSLEKRMNSEKRVGAVDQVDALTALKILQQSLTSGPPTEQRVIVMRVCLGVCLSMKKWPTDEFSAVHISIPILEDLCNYQKSFQNACDMSVFYANRQVLRPYLEEIYQNPNQASKLICLLAAFEACARPLRGIRHENPDSVIDKFREQVRKELDDCLIGQICREVEMNLRLLVHSHLSLPDRNPFDSTVRDLRQFIYLDTMYFLDDSISMRDETERYLNKTFYDLTTVALHDWKTYDEMRSLAWHLYGLTIMQAHLPCQTLEQGADILEIMRNINIFVTSYAYNLNNQVFVERTSASKHLNTVGIRHVANSLRTHGIGVMNTTVNYTYQFLRKQFNYFSQFMFDEHIKSRLIKDIKTFRDAKQSDAMARYPFDRAEKFNKGIRTLGVTAEGQTKLDQFRTLITHIGNAMGFVRTVRSGGLHHCSKAICFIPDLEDIESFEALSKEENIGADTAVAKDLDEVVTMLNQNFSEGTEFFKLLLEVFSAEFRNPKNRHLHNFYIIIPPLMVNFIEHAVTSKERLNKKNPSGLVLFTDDGFAMGVAYILALLDQNALFDSLNWIDAVREKFRVDAAAAAQANRPTVPGSRADAENDEKFKQALNLTLRRLDSYVKEFELLFYSLSSARIFFKANPTKSATMIEAGPTPSATEQPSALPETPAATKM